MPNQDEQNWLALWKRVGARGNVLEVYNNLLERYQEPHRHYHTLPHIQHCLTELQQARHLVLDYDAVEMALWYHDVVYNTKTGDNEKRSAALAFIVLKSAFLTDEFVERVANLILATKHLCPPTDNDEKIIVDIDLSSFGLPDEVFDENSRLIREEYAWVPEEVFARERIKILKAFLARPNIYLTQFFRDKYEVAAQRNLVRAIAQLSK